MWRWKKVEKENKVWGSEELAEERRRHQNTDWVVRETTRCYTTVR